MNDNLFIAELLKENFPLECEAAGPTNLQDIADGYSDLKCGFASILGQVASIVKGA